MPLSFSMIVLSSQMVIAVADGVPKFDIARSCKLDVAATAGLSVDQSLKACISDEQKARQQLAGQHPHPVNYGNIPSCTYCHPEVASIGLTEQQCKERKLDYKVGKFPFSANGRARTAGESEGFVKIIRDAKYGEILGAHIIGAHATELIHELVVARENEFTVEEIDLAIHAHPTLSEAVAEAVLDSMGKMLHA